MVTQTEAVSSKQMVFFILPNRPSLMRNSLFYTYTFPNQYVVIANAVSSNRIVIYWQLTIVSRNYRHITDASFGTNVLYVVSSMLTAVAFLCFPTYYVRCRQCVTAHT